MHPVEHILYLSNVLLHLVLASHPIHFLFSLQVKTLLAPTSHAGFEKLAADAESQNGVPVGDFFHQLHHRYFECNYGEPELPFDNWFGTFHDGTSEATQNIRAQIREKGITRT
jgi:sterol desaturase/sphingolipid hydroxylase (fatty acid hydroxylase superfamily)